MMSFANTWNRPMRAAACAEVISLRFFRAGLGEQEGSSSYFS